MAPVTATAGLQVVIGTAPINRASDPYHCTNTPMLANTLAGATAAVGYDDDYEKYTVCQSMGASFKVVGVSPMMQVAVALPGAVEAKAVKARAFTAGTVERSHTAINIVIGGQTT